VEREAAGGVDKKSHLSRGLTQKGLKNCLRFFPCLLSDLFSASSRASLPFLAPPRPLGTIYLQEYLGVIGQETSRRAHRLAFDLYRKCRSLKGLRRFASLFSCPAPEVGFGWEGGEERVKWKGRV
jgi:hypothetical protein